MKAEESWWERELPRLRALLHTAVRRRRLPVDAEDVVQETLLDTVHWIRTQAGQLTNWFTVKGPSDEATERTHLDNLASLILRRRIADAYRLKVRKWSHERLEEVQRARDTSEPSPDQQVEFAEMLAACLEQVASLSKKDRQVIDRLTEARSGQPPLTEAERARLTRIRKRIGKRLRGRSDTGPA